MEVTFRDVLEQALQVNETNNRKIQASSVDEIEEALNVPEYGVCSGCHGNLKKLSHPTVKIKHTSSYAADDCQYDDGYGMVPEWAFFPRELFEE